MHCLPITSMYYMSLLATSKLGQAFDEDEGQMHKDCTYDECSADHMDLTKYRTRHIEGCPGCESLGQSMQDVKDAWKKNSIPLMALTRNGQTFSLTTIQYKELDVFSGKFWYPYIAISHVWSQGLGNPTENKLPLCQLFRLHDMLGAGWNPLQPFGKTPEHYMVGLPVHEDKKKIRLLWMDTLCVPVGSPVRRKAIQMMKKVYQEAQAVLVIDTVLSGQPGIKGISCYLRSPESLCLRCLLISSSGTCLIIFSKNIRAPGEAGVTGVCKASYCELYSPLMSLALGSASARGFGMSARTVSGLNRNKPLPIYS